MRRLITLAILATLGVGTAVADTGGSDVDLSRYVTYAWGGCVSAQTLLPADDLSARQVRKEAEKEMRAQKMIEVTQHPDVYLSCVLSGDKLLGIAMVDAANLVPVWTADTRELASGTPVHRAMELAFSAYPTISEDASKQPILAD